MDAGGTYRYPVFSDDAPPQQNREIRDPHDADALADDLHDHLDIEGDVDGLLDDEDDDSSASDPDSADSDSGGEEEDPDGPPPPHAETKRICTFTRIAETGFFEKCMSFAFFITENVIIHQHHLIIHHHPNPSKSLARSEFCLPCGDHLGEQMRWCRRLVLFRPEGWGLACRTPTESPKG